MHYQFVKDIMKTGVTVPLWVESTSHRWFSSQRSSTPNDFYSVCCSNYIFHASQDQKPILRATLFVVVLYGSNCYKCDPSDTFYDKCAPGKLPYTWKIANTLAMALLLLMLTFLCKHKYICILIISQPIHGTAQLKCNSLIANDDHDDLIKWEHFPRNWPFVRGIHRSPMNSPHKGHDA